MTDDPLVVLQIKAIQKSYMNIVIRSEVYDTLREKTDIPIQEINNMTNRGNPDTGSRIYLVPSKVG